MVLQVSLLSLLVRASRNLFISLCVWGDWPSFLTSLSITWALNRPGLAMAIEFRLHLLSPKKNLVASMQTGLKLLAQIIKLLLKYIMTFKSKYTNWLSYAASIHWSNSNCYFSGLVLAVTLQTLLQLSIKLWLCTTGTHCTDFAITYSSLLSYCLIIRPAVMIRFDYYESSSIGTCTFVEALFSPFHLMLTSHYWCSKPETSRKPWR